jgi:membrane dipeptidase
VSSGLPSLARPTSRFDTAPSASQLASALGISRAAAELYLASDVLDLHVDSFIWRRLFGYDLHKRHGRGLLGGWFYSQCDVPRLREAAVRGAVWIITTNPFRSRAGRRRALLQNVERLGRELTLHGDVAIVSSASGYRAARAAGVHAALLGIQGGNALELSLDDFDRSELRELALVTLLHFTRSRIGAPALPRLLRFGSQRLSAFGSDYVRKLNERHILVDLAHISEAGFWDALAVHDRTQPLVVSHTACAHVQPHFRNLSDQQLKAVAERGGLVGIIFNAPFIGAGLWSARVERVVDHIAHAVALIGADHVAIGSDFDGAIVPPRDLASVSDLPRLADAMLRRGLGESAVQKVLGGSFLRVLAMVRP